MEFLSVLFLINCIQGLFLIAILSFNSKEKLLPNFFLIALLIIIIGYQTKAIIVLEGYYTSFPHSIKIFLPIHFLLGPLFFFYVKFSISDSIQLKVRDSLHLIPFIICFLILLPFYVKSGQEKLALHSAPAPGRFQMKAHMLFYYGSILISALFYCWKSLQLIHLKNNLIDGRSSKIYRSKLIWLRNYTRVFLIFLICFFLCQLIFVFTDFNQFYVMLTTVFASSIMVHFVAYWSIKKSFITNTIPVKKETSTVFHEKVPLVKKEIIKLLEEEKIYLKNDLSIKDFCERLAINSQYLSKVVNSEFDCNLSYLINSYRVKNAIEVIESGAYNHLNFLGIANMVGFKSANTFTRVFKKHTGKTPSEYKKSI